MLTLQNQFIEFWNTDLLNKPEKKNTDTLAYLPWFSRDEEYHAIELITGSGDGEGRGYDDRAEYDNG